MRTIFLLVMLAWVSVGTKAYAAGQCEQIQFGIVDWTDVKATTAVASELLQALGYNVEMSSQSVADTYQAWPMATSTCSLATGCRVWRPWPIH